MKLDCKPKSDICSFDNMQISGKTKRAYFHASRLKFVSYVTPPLPKTALNNLTEEDRSTLQQWSFP